MSTQDSVQDKLKHAWSTLDIWLITIPDQRQIIKTSERSKFKGQSIKSQNLQRAEVSQMNRECVLFVPAISFLKL